MNWLETLRESPMFNNPNRVNDIGLLYPPFYANILLLLHDMRAEGLRPIIFETYRSQKRQEKLYEEGKTKIKTDGTHHFGVAVDFVDTDATGGPYWPPVGALFWQRLGHYARARGLYWGGDWKKFLDCPHVQACATPSETWENIKKGVFP